MKRIDWLMAKDPSNRPVDPAQIVSLVAMVDFAYLTEKALQGQSKYYTPNPSFLNPSCLNPCSNSLL
jgi:hypothetical protein